jgi:DNA-3-methyladenine glycosylase
LIRLERTFYEQDTLRIAKELLGCYLVRKSIEGTTIGKIVETEAYIGPYDKASHAYKGKYTQRTKVQFGPGGYAYIYQIYGINYCFNVVTQQPGMPEVVLIRALEPMDGIELMSKRRNSADLTGKEIKNLTNGPSKLCKAMAIDRSLYGIDLCSDVLFLASSDHIWDQEMDVVTTKRINIDYAEEAKSYLWRFIIKNNPCISKS